MCQKTPALREPGSTTFPYVARSASLIRLLSFIAEAINVTRTFPHAVELMVARDLLHQCIAVLLESTK